MRRTSTMLGEGAELLEAPYRGDLRRLRDEAGSTARIHEALQEFPGIGPTGADIFCREVQGVWGDLAPYLDTKVLDCARRLGLPASADELSALVRSADLTRLGAACVHAALDGDVVAEVREAAG